MDDADEILIEDLDEFRVVDNPTRQRILHLARHPRSVGELARAMGVPVTRLYYHVNMLEEHGFLQVVEVRKSGAQLERVYRSRKGVIRPSPALIDRIDDKRKAARVMAGILLDITRAEVETALARNLEGDTGVGSVARMVLQLPDDAVADFTRRLEALVEEMRTVAAAHHGEGAIHSFTYAFVPTDSD